MDNDRLRNARARMLLRTTARRHLYDPRLNVNMIDYGTPVRTSAADERPTLRFHVDKKLSPYELQSAGLALVPRRIGEFITDVVEGQYSPHIWPWMPAVQPSNQSSPTARRDPLRGGISISDLFHNAAGTLGALVRDRDSGAAMILSNWHVLVVEWTARPGQRLCQPGRLDGGVFGDVVAQLTRHAMSANLDAAVAKLTGSRALINDQLGLGAVTGTGRAQLGMRVTKSGRTTGVTRGVVTGVDGIARLNYGGLLREIRHVVAIEPRTPAEPVSDRGDSGSLWLDAQTKQAIGLHFAGSDMPERGLALDLQSVLDALNVDIVTDLPPVPSRLARSRVIAGFSAAPVDRPEEELVLR